MSTNGLSYFPGNRSTNGTSGYAMGTSTITSLSSGYVIYANSSKTLTSTLVSLTAINQLITNTFTSLTSTSTLNVSGISTLAALTVNGTLTLPTGYTANATGTNYFVKANSSSGVVSYDTTAYAPLASPSFSGTVTLSSGTASAFVITNSANQITYDTTAYAPLASPTFSGTIAITGSTVSSFMKINSAHQITYDTTAYATSASTFTNGSVVLDGYNSISATTPTYNIYGARFIYSNYVTAVAIGNSTNLTTLAANFTVPTNVTVYNVCNLGITTTNSTSTAVKYINPYTFLKNSTSTSLFTYGTNYIRIDNTIPGYYYIDMNIVVNYNKNTTSLFVGLINYTTNMTNSTATNLYLVSAFTSANCDLFNVVYVNNNCASINLSGVIYVSTSNGYLYLLMSTSVATYFTYYQSIDIQRIS